MSAYAFFCLFSLLLPPEAEEGLFEAMLALSGPGSRIAVEHLPDSGAQYSGKPAMKEAAERMGVDMEGLLSFEPRREPISWLREQGWAVEVTTVAEAYERYERPVPELFDPGLVQGRFFVADLPG